MVVWAEKRCPTPPSLPMAGESSGPEVLRVGELSLPSPATALRRVADVPSLGNTVELVLTVKAWDS